MGRGGRAGRIEREWLQRGRRKLLGVMDMLIILIVVMALRVYEYVKTHQIDFKYTVYCVLVMPR